MIVMEQVPEGPQPADIVVETEAKKCGKAL